MLAEEVYFLLKVIAILGLSEEAFSYGFVIGVIFIILASPMFILDYYFIKSLNKQKDNN
jgi:hypothetical protein